MNYREVLETYQPQDSQEAKDKVYMLEQITLYGDRWLDRDCPGGHLTVGAFLVNPQRDQVLFIHHKLRHTWSWAGGHMDGVANPLQVAIKEAQEETGLKEVTPISSLPLAILVCHVPEHVRKGQVVDAHEHSIFSYGFEVNPQERLILNSQETNDIAWFPIEEIHNGNFLAEDVQLYGQLLERLKAI